MKLSNATLLFAVHLLITSYVGGNQLLEEAVATDPVSQYEYSVGLGYGFLGKAVHVDINDREVLSIVGTEEIEQYAQLQGTMMVEPGSSPEKDITVQVIVDKSKPYEQVIEVSAGSFIHIYYEQTGLHVFNTHFLVKE